MFLHAWNLQTFRKAIGHKNSCQGTYEDIVGVKDGLKWQMSYGNWSKQSGLWLFKIVLTILGMYGGWISRASTFGHWIRRKNAWSLISLSPFAPHPSLLVGFFVRSWIEKKHCFEGVTGCIFIHKLYLKWVPLCPLRKLVIMKQLDDEVSTPANDSQTCNYPRLAQKVCRLALIRYSLTCTLYWLADL